jgi:hypothetical protein
VTLTDTSPAGFLRILNPVFTWLAKNAKRKGTEETLLKKYYYQGNN